MTEPQRLTLVAGPSLLPVSLNEAKAQMRIDDDQVAEDATINGQIAAATAACERFTGRALIGQTWTLHRDDWPLAASTAGGDWEGVREGALSELRAAAREVSLPKPPLLQVVQVATYNEQDEGTVLPASDYFVDRASEPGRIVLRTGAAVPAITRAANGLEIQFVAGYGDDPHDVPEPIRLGLLQLVAALNENRGDCPMGELVTVSGAGDLWRPFRILQVR